MKTIFSALFIAIMAMMFLAPIMPVSAAEKCEYATPANITALDGAGIKSALSGNTVLAHKGTYRQYFKPNGSLIVFVTTTHNTWYNTWSVCGNILILDYSMNRGEVKKRFVVDAGDNKLSFYDLKGGFIQTEPVVNGEKLY